MKEDRPLLLLKDRNLCQCGKPLIGVCGDRQLGALVGGVAARMILKSLPDSL